MSMPKLGQCAYSKDIGFSSNGNSAYRKYIWHACVICSKERWVPFEKGKPRHDYCYKCISSIEGWKDKMRDAHLKDKNPNWKGDNASWESGWERARYLYGNNSCEICGNIKVEIHHIDGNPLNNERNNIRILCRKHHMDLDGRNTRRDKLGRFN